MPQDPIHEYYSRRAESYEQIYAKPERQGDLSILREEISRLSTDERVLEVACGTGYWTTVIASVAKFVLAVDQSEETLSIARQKQFKRDNVAFLSADAYTLNSVPEGFSLGLAGFWWSHIPKSQVSEFLEQFHSKLRPNAKVVFFDNQFVTGSNTPIARTDSDGNTYQTRALPDGSTFEILKNFPSDKDLRESLKPWASAVSIRRFHYFWLAEYQLP